MKTLKPSHFLILCAFIALMSCKKEKKPILKIEEVVLPQPIPVSPQPSPPGQTETEIVDKGIYIPIKFEGSGLNLNLKYKDDTALLTEISDENDNRTVITYTVGQQPQKLEKYLNGKLFYIAHYQQADKKTTNKVLLFKHIEKPSNSTPIGSYSLTYNGQQKISSINYYNNSNVLLNTNTRSYTSILNLSEMNNTEPVNSTAYSFDQKIGICSNVAYSDLLTLELEHWFLLCSANNVLTVLNQQSSDGDMNVDYEYNENNYPSNVRLTDNKGKQTIKVTYKRLDI